MSFAIASAFDFHNPITFPMFEPHAVQCPGVEATSQCKPSLTLRLALLQQFFVGIIDKAVGTVSSVRIASDLSFFGP